MMFHRLEFIISSSAAPHTVEYTEKDLQCDLVTKTSIFPIREVRYSVTVRFTCLLVSYFTIELNNLKNISEYRYNY